MLKQCPRAALHVIPTCGHENTKSPGKQNGYLHNIYTGGRSQQPTSKETGALQTIRIILQKQYKQYKHKYYLQR